MANFDWTPVITGLITALGAFLTYVAKAYVMPWLTERRLAGAAVTIVNAVEVLMKECIGEEKCRAAIDKLIDMGFKMDYDSLRQAVEAAYNQMHIAQVAAGLKEPNVTA